MPENPHSRRGTYANSLEFKNSLLYEIIWVKIGYPTWWLIPLNKWLIAPGCKWDKYG
jgi:hypothetical protein